MIKFYAPCLMAFLSISLISQSQSSVSNVHIATSVAVPGGSLNQTITSHNAAVNGIQASTNYNVSYNNNGNVNIIDFTVAGRTYVRFDNFDTVIIRRVANTWEPTGGNKQQIYCQGPILVDNLFHNMPFPPAFPQVTNHAYMERVMKEGYINRGSDNVFNNDPNSDQTSNNIERVDFIYKNGIATMDTSLAGFLIAERGGNDAFKIAAVTAVDANGNPTSFGSVLSVSQSAYGLPITSATTYVLRKDVSDNVMRPFSLVPNQSIRGVFISFRHLGISAMQKIYGYALMANDVTATTSAQLLAYTNNTYFPRTTTTTAGGMDLASAPGIFHTNLVLAGHFLSIEAQNKNCKPVIQWKDKEYANVRIYQVERSYDRENFEPIAAIAAEKADQHDYIDQNNQQPVSYYRLKVIQENGASYYSSVVYTNTSCMPEKVSIYPNPVQDHVTISMTNSISVDQITLFSYNGKEFGKWAMNGNEQQVKLNLAALPRGQYFVVIKEKSGISKSYPLLKL
jgi:hypothetical protein